MAGDWRDIENDKEKYAAYLCSREWAEKREAVRDRSGGLCERCGVNPMNACHHLTYLRKYGEFLEDLQAICTPCHEFTHGKSDYDPAWLAWVRSEIQVLTEIYEFATSSKAKARGKVASNWFFSILMLESNFIVSQMELLTESLINNLSDRDIEIAVDNDE